jgi:alkanesulfonate monooxygenase SsuD/methylene tetrahydromethanopterin reductase-like flavin-dependent oxidoreductase (luciferase family)
VTSAADPGRLPIGIQLGTIGVPYSWWRESARRLDDAGYQSVWCWDHFASRGKQPKSVLESWTTLTGVAAVTGRITMGPFVANVMNRHPAVLARMATTLQELSGGRLVLGIGIGGFPAEHEAYGIAFPPTPERVARLEEAVAVIRALWTGDVVTHEGRYYPLRDARSLPRAEPAPRIIVAGQSPGGARLAARAGDGWTTTPELLEPLRPVYEDALASAARSRSDMRVIVGWEGGRSGEDALSDGPWLFEPSAEWKRWQDRGADAVALIARTTADIDRLVDAVSRW